MTPSYSHIVHALETCAHLLEPDDARSPRADSTPPMDPDRMLQALEHCIAIAIAPLESYEVSPVR